MIRRIKYGLLLIFTSLSFAGCVKIGEMYVGLHLQPDMDNSPVAQGLNVYGILKAGPTLDTSNHYFEVQQLVDLMDWSEGIEIHDADITLDRIDHLGNTTVYNPAHIGDALYRDINIDVAPGDRWLFHCSKDSFVVQAECVVPNIPVVNDLTVFENQITLVIEQDSSASMYWVYVLDGENYKLEQKLASSANTQFEIQVDWAIDKETAIVFIVAYDENLREYQTTSNTFFKPNAFRPSFTTVEGGYGTFGAVSSSMILLENK